MELPVATETEGANPWVVLGWLNAGREDALGKRGCEVAGMGFSCTLIFTRSSFLGNLFLSCLLPALNETWFCHSCETEGNIAAFIQIKTTLHCTF